MSYIDRNLLADERILFRARKHLVIFFLPAVWIIFCFFAWSYMAANPLLSKLVWLPWVLALFFFLYVWLEYIASEYVVTNRRIMMREGFFYRHTNETRLATISQINVNQSLLGQILNFGTVIINAFGAFDTFTMIAKPFLFQKYVNEQLDKVAK